MKCIFGVLLVHKNGWPMYLVYQHRLQEEKCSSLLQTPKADTYALLMQSNTLTCCILWHFTNFS